MPNKFEMTSEGYNAAKAWLIETNQLDKLQHEQSVDGYTLTALANKLYKDQKGIVMIKPALCINKEEATKPIHHWTPRLIEREQCETDESVLQLIPYIILMDKETNEVFIYQRGKQGAESRLHAKWSIGVGGHVDIEPIANNLPLTLATEAVREIEEEVGYIVPEEDKEAIIAHLRKGDYGLIYLKDSTIQVDRVHLGLAIVVGVDKTKVTKFEDNIINDANWITVDELRAMVHPRQSVCVLENWSRICVEEMF